jgi:mRNA interferase HigB
LPLFDFRDHGVAGLNDAPIPLATKRAAWRHLADVRADFPHGDAVGIFTVFDIRGNKYPLISVIKYGWQIVYIRHILAHAEYDKGKWRL